MNVIIVFMTKSIQKMNKFVPKFLATLQTKILLVQKSIYDIYYSVYICSIFQIKKKLKNIVVFLLFLKNNFLFELKCFK